MHFLSQWKRFILMLAFHRQSLEEFFSSETFKTLHGHYLHWASHFLICFDDLYWVSRSRQHLKQKTKRCFIQQLSSNQNVLQYMQTHTVIRMRVNRVKLFTNCFYLHERESEREKGNDNISFVLTFFWSFVLTKFFKGLCLKIHINNITMISWK